MSGPSVTQSMLHRLRELMQSGRHADAVAALQPVCQSAPDNAEAWYLLGCSYAKLGRWQEAGDSFQKSIDLQPNIAWSHFALGGVRLALEDFERATGNFRRALELDDSIADAHSSLANIYITQGQLVRARSHLNRVLDLNPANRAVHRHVGRLEQECGNYDRALASLERALKSDPRDHQALCIKGSVLINLARMDEALSCYEQALEIAPDSVDAVSGLVSVHEFKGERDKAMELIDAVLRRNVLNPNLAMAFARICRHEGRCAEAVDYINRIIASPALVRSTRRMLHFAAGRALDSLCQYHAAFSHYRAGNAIDPPLYDAVAHAQAIDELIRVFGPGTFMRFPRAGRKDSRPVFIVGMPRSGTSLTEQILAAHSRVYAAGELDALGRVVQSMPRQLGCEELFPGYVAGLSQGDIEQMSGRYLQRLTALSAGAERVIDKMPHNFYYLGLIELLFPAARIIHCHRDPLDTGLSIYFQDFTQGHAYAKSLFDIGVHYHQYQRLMEHWKRVLSLPMVDVCYEDLVSNQEMVTRRLLEFCELDWDENCLDFHQLQRAVHTSSYDQVRQPLYRKSVGRWRNYEPYLDELKEGLGRGY